MYLHIGDARIVFSREVIGIFKYDQYDNMINREFLESLPEGKINIIAKAEKPKSFVVTDNKVFLSPISPLTLGRRQKNNR